MYNLYPDFISCLPHIVDAYANVLGEEYRDIIHERVNRTMILYYYDYHNIIVYLYYLKKCKKRELQIRFLEENGYDVSSYNKENYSKDLNEELSRITGALISTHYAFGNDDFYGVPIKAFDIDNTENKEIILDNQLSVINYLLPDDYEEITTDNYDSFKNTKEYSELIKKINKMLETYDKLSKEYNEWEKNLAIQEDYVKNEQEREDEILSKYQEKLYLKIFNRLPEAVKLILEKKPLDEQIKIIFDEYHLVLKFPIEYFNSENFKILNDPNADINDRDAIMINQYFYFKDLGIPVVKISTSSIEESINKFLWYINREEIKKYIPSTELCDKLKKYRDMYYKRAEKEFLETRSDVIDCLKYATESGKKGILETIKKGQICVNSNGATNSNNDFFSVMFFSKRDCGLLAHDLLHEFFHVITQSGKDKIGFELLTSGYKNLPLNPYLKKYRLHERLNEALTDIYCEEANNYLQSKGIYLIESKEFTDLNVEDNNTWNISKEILIPLTLKYKKEIVESLMNSDSSIFMSYIGEDNYNELNDVMNKIDSLMDKGVGKLIKDSSKSRLVRDYYEQIQRVQQIYANIDNYYSSKEKDKCKKIGSMN